MNIEANIKQYLEDHGIVQSYLSRKAGVPLAKLNLSLNGKRKMTLPEYRSVCRALGVSADTFLEPHPPA